MLHVDKFFLRAQKPEYMSWPVMSPPSPSIHQFSPFLIFSLDHNSLPAGMARPSLTCSGNNAFYFTVSWGDWFAYSLILNWLCHPSSALRRVCIPFLLMQTSNSYLLHFLLQSLLLFKWQTIGQILSNENETVARDMAVP